MGPVGAAVAAVLVVGGSSVGSTAASGGVTGQFSLDSKLNTKSSTAAYPPSREVLL